jgi:hypothetical protein
VNGIAIYTDANLPVNLGAGTNEDAILVFDAQAPIILEQPGSPLMLTFKDTPRQRRCNSCSSTTATARSRRSARRRRFEDHQERAGGTDILMGVVCDANGCLPPPLSFASRLSHAQPDHGATRGIGQRQIS